MSTWTNGHLLVAQLSRTERLRGMAWTDRSPTVEQVTAVVLVLAGLAVLSYLVWRLVRRYLRTVREQDAAGRLFDELSIGHHLTHHEVRLLRDIASRMGLTDPVVLFVRKSLLERELRRESSPALAELVRKLFG